MKISKKFRNTILNYVAEIAVQKLTEHCPEIKGDTPPEMWDEKSRERFDLITDVASAIERGLTGKLSSFVR